MTITRYIWSAIRLYGMVIPCGQFRVNMVVVDGLTPVGHQDIFNHHDDVGLFVHLKSTLA